jgi:hypothetical protein
MSSAAYNECLRQLLGFYCSAAANNTEEKILNFANLESGWHLGEGVPIDARAMCEACSLNALLLTQGFFETDAFPGLSGEVQLTADFNNDYFEFTREPNGEWSFIHEHSDDVITESYALNLTEVENIAGGLHERICNTSDLYHENIGTNDTRGLPALLSSHQAMVEYPLLNRTASSPFQIQSVLICEPITQAQGSRLFSGRSRMQSFQATLKSFRRQAIQGTRVIGK